MEQLLQFKKKLKINNKSFNDNKARLIELLKKEFNDISLEVLNILEIKRGQFEDLEQGNKASRQFKNRKKQKALMKKVPNPCRMNVIFGQRLKDKLSNDWIYYAVVSVDQSKTSNIIAYSPGNWETIYKKEVTLEGKSNLREKMKSKLEKLIKKEKEEAERIVKTNNDLARSYNNSEESEVAA